MYNTLALFALFTIGSADFQCDDYADAATAENKPCSNDGNLIGTCNASTTCIVTSTCANDGENCGHVGNATFMGKCVKPDASAGTCFADSAIPAGQCAPGNLATTYCKHATSNFIGKCNAASTNLCVVASVSCTADGENCGSTGFMGKCVKPMGGGAGTCFADSAIPAGQCAPGNLATTYCKKRNLVGMCNAQAKNECVTADKCKDLKKEATCGGGTHKGWCDADAGNCMYTAPCVEHAATGSACKSGALIGMCNSGANKVCITSDQCTVDGKPCGMGALMGMGKCVASTKTCVDAATIPSGQCAPGNAKNIYCNNAGQVGKCTDATPPLCTVLPTSDCPTVDATCGSGVFKGWCDSEQKCMYAAPCETGAATGSGCKSGSLIGQCNSQAGGLGKVCKTSDQCTVDWKPCGMGALMGMGKCVASSKTCVDAATIPSGQCAPGNLATTYCKKGNLVGMCNAQATNECVTADKCKGLKKEATCGGGTHKGWCDADAGNCMYTAPCADGAAPDSYCKNASLIGKCNSDASSSNRVCITTKPCATKKKDAACGHASTTAFMGYCTADDGNCTMGNPVKVGYKIQVTPEALDTQAEREELATKVATDGFKNGLAERMKLSLANSDAMCSPEQPDIANSDATFRACLAKSHMATSAACTTACTSGFVVQRKHTRKCNSGKWEGDAGVCGKMCEGGTVVDGETTFTLPGSTDAEGSLECKAPAGYQRFTGAHHMPCTQICKEGYRVKSPSTRGCNESRAWIGTKGSCEPSAHILASATIVLEDSADHGEITGKRDEMFNDKFKESVAALIDGVSKENVIIVTINPVTTGRRLNEKAVEVNYAIQVAKGDPAEDEGRLGGLRGIR